MRNRAKFFSLVFCALFLVLFASGCSKDNKSTPPPADNSASNPLAKDTAELLSYSNYISAPDETLVKDKRRG